MSARYFSRDTFLLSWRVFGQVADMQYRHEPAPPEDDTANAQCVVLWTIVAGVRTLGHAVEKAQPYIEQCHYHPQYGLAGAHRSYAGPAPHWYRVTSAYCIDGKQISWMSQMGAQLTHTAIIDTEAQQ